jgi:hypothetical protein
LWTLSEGNSCDGASLLASSAARRRTETASSDRIGEAISDAPPKLVMLALSDALQEHLTRLVELDAHTGASGSFAGRPIQLDQIEGLEEYVSVVPPVADAGHRTPEPRRR